MAKVFAGPLDMEHKGYLSSSFIWYLKDIYIIIV